MVRSLMTTWLSDWQRKLTTLVFPPFCLVCDQSGTWCCAACRAEAEPLPLGWCSRCQRRAPAATTTCRRCARALRLTSLTSCFAYRGSIEALIRSIKFLPAAVGINVLLELPTVQSRFQLTRPTWLIPVPCAPEREATRGFNQAERLARGLIGSSGSEVVDRLERIRRAPAQVGLSAVERRRNAVDLYHWIGPPLAGQRCVLVDDVATTGATLAATTTALRRAGARRVDAVTIAQTPR